MTKKNCWEILNCERQADGVKTIEFGICPAATSTVADGFLGGINSGRACMFITGTLCSGRIEGTHEDKEKHCLECNFYKLVAKEEGLEKISIFSFNKYIDKKTII